MPVDKPHFIPRRGIWEMHGSATEPSVRNIDDMLFSQHNSTVSTFSAHRPTEADALTSQGRCVRQRFPVDPLSGWPSDFQGLTNSSLMTPKWQTSQSWYSMIPRGSGRLPGLLSLSSLGANRPRSISLVILRGCVVFWQYCWPCLYLTV